MGTFDWNRPEDWLKSTASVILNLCGIEFVERLRINNVKPNVFDFKWLENSICQSNHYNTEVFLNDFVSQIVNIWSSILAYHSCRVNQIEDYYINGIIPPTIEKLNDIVRAKIEPFIDNRTIDELLILLGKNYNINDEKVFVSIDKTHLILHCTHHLEYGSEYLLSAIMLLQKFGINIKPILVSVKGSKMTKPTVFESELPMNIFSRNDLMELSIILLTETCNRLLNIRYFPLSRRTGFSINGKLQPRWIKSHYHPHINESLKSLPAIWIDSSYPSVNS